LTQDIVAKVLRCKHATWEDLFCLAASLGSLAMSAFFDTNAPVVLSILGALLGGLLVAKAANTAEAGCDRGKCVNVCSFFVVLPVACGLYATSVSGTKNEPPAAALIVGLTSALVSICGGYFATVFIPSNDKQPRVFVGGVLVYFFIDSAALYGLIVGLAVQSSDPSSVSAQGLVGLVACAVLGLAGSTVAVALAGVKIMEVGVNRPDFMQMHSKVLLMGGFPGIYVLIAAIIINGKALSAPNAGLAAGLIMGVTIFVNGVCMGSFWGTFAMSCGEQPRVVFGGQLILLFFGAVALCGLIMTLVILSRSACLGDMTYEDATGLATCTALGFAGSSVAIMTAGGKIMQMGVSRPDLIMRCLSTVAIGSFIGLCALIAGLSPNASAQGYIVAGVLFFASGACCAVVSAKCIPELDEHPKLFPKMLSACATCGCMAVAGLATKVVLGGHPIYGAASQEVTGPALQLAASADGVVAPLVCVAVGAFAAFAAVVLRRPAPSSMASPLIQ